MSTAMPRPAAAKDGIPGWAWVLIGIALLFMGVMVIGIVAAIAIPAMMRARMAGNEAAAIATMRSIAAAQATYASSCGGGLFAGSLAVLGKPPTDGRGTAFMTDDLTRGGERVQRGGYVYWIDASPASVAGTTPPCNGVDADKLSTTYIARAEPINRGTGRRYFATSESGIVYQSVRPIRFGPNGSPTTPVAMVQ